MVLGENMDMKKTRALLDACNEVSVELNAEKTIGENHYVKVTRKSFQMFGKCVNISNYIQGEVKSILNWGNACYHAIQDLLFSRLVSKNVRIKIYGGVGWIHLADDRGRWRAVVNVVTNFVLS
jgi:hypothetical protein